MFHLSRCVRIIRKILKESKACVDSLKNLTLTNNPQVDELVAGAPEYTGFVKRLSGNDCFRSAVPAVQGEGTGFHDPVPEFRQADIRRYLWCRWSC